jgi:predicted dehydrogenase
MSRAAPAGSPDAAAPRARLRVGVVGLGYWGPNIARNLAAIPGCELIWLCDERDEPRARLAPQFPRARATAQLEEMLADSSLDAVLIATPVATHAELAGAVLAAGKHCFVEKPLATSVADA